MEKKKTSLLFKILRALIRLFYGRVDIRGLENLPQRDAVIVANHTQLNGPITGELFLPDSCYIWCAGQMMKWKEVPGYAFQDFWSQKPKWTHPFFKALSYAITPLAVCIFNNARTVPVYRDSRIVGTFKQTVKHLENGKNILIFPEKDEKANNILYKFQENFIDIARLYYKRTGKTLTFVPMYIAPTTRTAYIGKGTAFDPAAPMADERGRIAGYCFDAITRTARALPAHTVVPYRNIGRKHYLSNKDITEVPQ